MTKSFEQKRFFNKLIIDFQENGILYSRENIISSKQSFIEYENILFQQITKETKTDKFNLFVCILSAITLLKSLIGIYDNPNGIYKGLMPFSFIFFVVFLVVTLLGRGKFVTIATAENGPIKLFNNKSDENVVNQFLKDFTKYIKSYLKSKYTDIDSDIPKETQLENLFWLKRSKIISKQEYENLKAQLLNDTPPLKGFRSN